MSDKNRIAIMHILDVVRNGLGPYVLAKYKQTYGKEYIERLVADVGRIDEEHLNTEVKILGGFDAQRWLKAMTKYRSVFKDELGSGASRGSNDFNRSNAISFAYELLDARNVWAHANASDRFDDDGVHRIAENATRLLLAVGAREEANNAEAIMRRIGMRIYAKRGNDEGQQLAVVQQQLERTKQELSSSKQELTSLKGKYSATSKEQNSTRRELTNCKRKLTEVRKGLTATAAELASAKKQLETSEQKLRATADELRLTKRRLAYKNIELESRGSTSNAAPLKEPIGKSVGRGKDDRPATAESGSVNSANVVNLRGQMLRGKDLSGDDLSKALLMDADLAGARLRDAQLSEANLANANLCEADMTGANLRGANLTGADLRNATLVNTDFTGAILVRARLGGSLDRSTKLPDGTNWSPSRAMNDFLRA